MSDELLTDILDTIAAERDDSDRTFQLVDELLARYGQTDLAHRLYDAIAPSRPWQQVADLFGILIWSTNDNGFSLMREMEHWLESADDVRKIQIALHLDVYPFTDRAEMERVLAEVARRHPEVAGECQRLVESRRRHLERRDD